MATSNSYDYSLTANDIAEHALFLTGEYGEGDTPSSADISRTLRAFEMMIKTWQAMGVHLWAYQEATLFLEVGKQSYSLAGDRCVSDFTETELSADAASGATSISVDSITGISNGDTIGVQQGSTSIHWTTVNGAPSGSTVNLSDALTEAAEEDNKVYVYASTDLIVRPLRIKQIRRRNDNQDTPIIELGRHDYFMLPNKSTQSTITQWYYDPGRDTGTLYVWPTASTVDDTLKLTVCRPLQDIDTSTNNLDFPQEWLEALSYNLATRIAPLFGLTLMPEVVQLARSLFYDLEGWDREDTSVQMQPNWRGW